MDPYASRYIEEQGREFFRGMLWVLRQVSPDAWRAKGTDVLIKVNLPSPLGEVVAKLLDDPEVGDVAEPPISAFFRSLIEKGASTV